MSKSSEFDKTIKSYILDHVDGSGYDADPETIEDKVKFLHDTFYSEYGFKVPQVGEQAALREWFMGLPSACTVAFCNNEVLSLAEKWGYLDKDATESRQQKILNNWFNLVAGKTSQMFRKYNV